MNQNCFRHIHWTGIASAVPQNNQSIDDMGQQLHRPTMVASQGQNVVLAGFGDGLSWGGLATTLPKELVVPKLITSSHDKQMANAE